jgi:ribosomal protein L44E
MFHRHTWVIRSTHKFYDGWMAKKTHLLYVCSGCGKAKTKDVKGWFELADVAVVTDSEFKELLKK